MVSQVGSSAGFSAAALSGSACRGPRDAQAMQEKLFSKLDVNSDGSVDESELGQFLDYASSATGSTSQTDAASLLKAIDADGDGSVSKTELADGAKALFYQLRSQLMSSIGGSADSRPPEKPDEKSLFAAMDSNSDGAISQDELGAFMQANPPPVPAGGSQQAGEEVGHSGGHGDHKGGGLFGALQALVDQYRSNSADDSSSPATSTLAVAA